MAFRVAAALAATAFVAAQIEPNNNCDPDYDCNWHFTDKYGVVYEFDFSHHCSSVGYRLSDASNHTYYFNICGKASERCAPKEHHVRYSYGAAIQTWGSTPLCNTSDPTASYYDPVLNKTMCYTMECEVLGVGTPIWELQNPIDPADGGVLLRHEGVPPSLDDPNRCPLNPATGAEWERGVTFKLNCDRSMAKNDIRFERVYENTTCRYVIEATTAAACACLPDCYGKNCGSDGCGGYCSGSALGGLCPFGQQCNQQTQVCCRADCSNRDCGDDGCGGSCGTCGSDETCSPQQVCLSSTPFIPTAAATYAPDSSGLTGAYFGGALVGAVVLGVVWFFQLGGRASFDKWRFTGAGGSPADKQSLMGASAASSKASYSSGASADSQRGFSASAPASRGGYGT